MRVYTSSGNPVDSDMLMKQKTMNASTKSGSKRSLLNRVNRDKETTLTSSLSIECFICERNLSRVNVGKLVLLEELQYNMQVSGPQMDTAANTSISSNWS